MMDDPHFVGVVTKRFNFEKLPEYGIVNLRLPFASFFFFFFVVREFYPICHQLMPHLRKWSFTLLINHTDITSSILS